MIRLALLATLLATPALAVPPPAGSEADAELQRMAPNEREWIARQHDGLGRWCCDQGDFDFVTVEQHGDQLQAKAKHPDMSRGIPSGWIDVPDEKRVDLRGQKDVPDVIAAWFYQGRIQCIILGGQY